jgi:SAM-dependent methyltransferase
VSRRPDGTSRAVRIVHVACDLCGDTASTEYASGSDFEYQTTLEVFRFVQCRRCGFLYLNPRPDASELRTIYPPAYYSYVQRQNRPGANLVSQLRARYYCARLRRAFQGFAQPGRRLRVLDVGCGDGRFLDLMRLTFGDAVETHGIDFDPEAVDIAARSGHQTRTGTIEDADYPDGFFDLIYISHVIEHLASPRAFLGTAHRLLAPGGGLHVETPNADCAEARLFRRTYWGGYHFPRHWHLFTPETLRALGTQCGFDVRAVSYSPSPVFLNWTFHHVLWNHGWSRRFADVFSVTGIYRNTLHALALIIAFSLVERGLRLFSGGRGSGLVCLLIKRS